MNTLSTVFGITATLVAVLVGLIQIVKNKDSVKTILFSRVTFFFAQIGVIWIPFFLKGSGSTTLLICSFIYFVLITIEEFIYKNDLTSFLNFSRVLIFVIMGIIFSISIAARMLNEHVIKYHSTPSTSVSSEPDVSK